MNDSSFLGLVQNAALLLAVAFIFDAAATKWHAGQTLFKQVIVGLALGAIGIIIMLTPWTFKPGIVFDTRSVLIGISGLFFGSFPAVITMAMTAAFRFYLGGTGIWTGVAVILVSGLTGIAWRYFRRRSLAEISWGELYLFGMVIHLAMLATMFTLPMDTALRVLSNISLPVLVIYPLGTALLGTLMANRLRREQAEDERNKLLSWQQGVNLLQQSLLAPAALEEKLRAVTDSIVSLFGADFSRIWLIQPGDLCEKGCVHADVHEGPHICRYRDRCLHLLASSGRYTHTDGKIHRRVPFGCYKIGRVASDDDHKFLTNDVQNDPRVHDREWARELGLVSFVGYQLRVPGGRTLGVLSLFAKHPISSPEDAILDGLSSTVALVIQRDIVERSLLNSEEKHRLLFDSAGDAIFIHDTRARILAVNPLACEQLGYTYEELMSMTVDQVDSPGEASHAPDRIARLMDQGHLTFETVHQRKDGSLIQIDVSAQRITWDGQPAMMSICRDITSRKLAEEELKRTMEKLRKSLVGTIHAMSLTVEARDPYTSGHQIRVSNLARVIAQEMGLPNDTVDTIRMAGIIHDIGKISIPAEILSKPGKLTDIEFSLIKAHPQSGYDIIKNTELPHPIAEIVLQHHERMDGSGYPRGLKGGQILLESRIISVTDVVEAMASHRPYRPGLGIDAGLEEIEKSKGILYDADAVDACLRLFREKGFSFKATRL
ncbi:MAG: LytS/YhcK type 5TM receptor domain-containing protein [Syntrophorhabdaceae bacterium]|nr:LytS/YhcK type 5TM receptor domain-containing protein [Syntrophorhabdaceae bacterium]